MAVPRKLRRRTPRRWAECPDDLVDYTSRVAPRRASRRSREDDGPIVITDDWPEQVPIGRGELTLDWAVEWMTIAPYNAGALVERGVEPLPLLDLLAS